MLVDNSTYDRWQREMRVGIGDIRDMPQRIVSLLERAREAFNADYKALSELNTEAFKRRLLETQRQFERQLDALKSEFDASFQRVQSLPNTVANSFALDAEQTALYSIAITRLQALGAFNGDEQAAEVIRRLKVQRVFERDPVLALATWLEIGNVADANGWEVTQSAIWELEPNLPDAIRAAIAAGRELSIGAARVQLGFAQAYRFLRQFGRERVYVPAWSEADGATAIDPASTRRVNSLQAV